jgi:Na+/glutamate symporter
MSEHPKYWFPAKRVGWGWGLPHVWQGWLVLIVFGALVVAGAIALLPKYGAATFVAYSAGLCVVLVLICWAKGEPPDGRK